MANLEVTAVIPALNEEAMIADTIRSLINQTYPLTELVVVDNGSTDRTAAIAKELGCTVLVSGGNLFDARELGTAYAKTPVVLSADADTVFPTWWLERAIAHINNNDNIWGVVGEIRSRTDSLAAKALCHLGNDGWWPSKVSRDWVSFEPSWDRGCDMLFRKDMLTPPYYSKSQASTRELIDPSVYGFVSNEGEWLLASNMMGHMVYDHGLYVLTDVPLSKQVAAVAYTALFPPAGLYLMLRPLAKKRGYATGIESN